MTTCYFHENGIVHANLDCGALKQKKETTTEASVQTNDVVLHILKNVS